MGLRCDHVGHLLRWRRMLADLVRVVGVHHLSVRVPDVDLGQVVAAHPVRDRQIQILPALRVAGQCLLQQRPDRSASRAVVRSASLSACSRATDRLATSAPMDTTIRASAATA